MLPAGHYGTSERCHSPNPIARREDVDSANVFIYIAKTTVLHSFPIISGMKSETEAQQIFVVVQIFGKLMHSLCKRISFPNFYFPYY